MKLWNQDGTLAYEIGGFSDTITGICYNPITKTIWVSSNLSYPLVFDAVTGTNVHYPLVRSFIR